MTLYYGGRVGDLGNQQSLGFADGVKLFVIDTKVFITNYNPLTYRYPFVKVV